MCERKYSIICIVKGVLKKWYIILAAGIVMASIFGFVSYKKGTEIKSQVALSDEQLQAVSYVKELQRQLAILEEYKDKSLRVKINPYSEARVIVQYDVDTNYVMNFTDEIEEDNTNRLLRAYSSFINNGTLYEEVQNEIEDMMSENDFEELVNGSIDTSTSAIVIQICTDSKEHSLKVAESIEAAMEKQSQVLSGKLWEHTLTLIDRSYTSYIDTDLYDFQAGLTNSMASLRDKIKEKETPMITEQLNLLSDNKEVVSQIDEKQVSKIDVLVGFIFGMACAFFYFVIRYILKDNIEADSELIAMFRKKYLGRVNVTNQFEVELNTVLNKIVLTCKRKNKQSVLLLIKHDESNEKTGKAIASCLQREGIDVEIGYDILNNIDTQKKMVSFELMFLGVSLENEKYSEIKSVIDFCDGQEKDIEGIIAIKNVK